MKQYGVCGPAIVPLTLSRQYPSGDRLWTSYSNCPMLADLRSSFRCQ